MVIQKFYETSVDHIPANPSAATAYAYKLFYGPDFSLVKYSTGHGFDFGISAQWFLARQFNKVSFAADLEFKTMRLYNNYVDNSVSSQTNFYHQIPLCFSI